MNDSHSVFYFDRWPHEICRSSFVVFIELNVASEVIHSFRSCMCCVLIWKMIVSLNNQEEFLWLQISQINACIECTVSHLNTEVNQCRANSVPGWATAWESLMLQASFLFPSFLIINLIIWKLVVYYPMDVGISK